MRFFAAWVLVGAFFQATVWFAGAMKYGKTHDAAVEVLFQRNVLKMVVSLLVGCIVWPWLIFSLLFIPREWAVEAYAPEIAEAKRKQLDAITRRRRGD